jgi:hypothetical protein
MRCVSPSAVRGRKWIGGFRQAGLLAASGRSLGRRCPVVSPFAPGRHLHHSIHVFRERHVGWLGRARRQARSVVGGLIAHATAALVDTHSARSPPHSLRGWWVLLSGWRKRAARLKLTAVRCVRYARSSHDRRSRTAPPPRRRRNHPPHTVAKVEAAGACSGRLPRATQPHLQ